MASGFLLNRLLGEALRKAYHSGDMKIGVLYLLEGLKIGEYRVMLKRNFDTACWVPPVGQRGSHSIYYGDRMLRNTILFFCKTHKADLPTAPTKAEMIVLAQKRMHDEALEAYKKAPAKTRAKVKKPELTDFKPSGLERLNQLVLWLKANASDDLWKDFVDLLVKAVVAFGRHERSHARETPIDMKQTIADLKSFGIPFGLWNLFEDARIEHISRMELKEPFGWGDIESIGEAPKTPMALFWRLIHLEGVPDKESLDSTESLAKGESVSVVAESVEAYYKRAIACPTAEALLPVMADFVEEFKEYVKADDSGGTPDASGSGSAGSSAGASPSKPGDDDDFGDDGESETESAGDTGTDLTVAAEAASKGEEFFAEFEKDAEVVGGTDAEGKEAEAKAKEELSGSKGSKGGKQDSNKEGGLGIPDSVIPTASGGRCTPAHFLAATPGQVDEAYRKKVDNVTDKLMRMFRQISLTVATETPGRRMSPRHLARNEIRYPQKKVMGGKGKRRYSIVYDCSGSMSGTPDREGKVLLLALNNLARRGYLQGSLVLSGYVNGQPGWLQYEFPVAEDVILSITPSHGAEGLQDALKDNLKHIKGMDDVFVYTDASITDAPIRRDFFAGHRIWPVGLYVGDADRTGEMQRHFPQNIVRSCIEDLVEAMLLRNRRTVG